MNSEKVEALALIPEYVLGQLPADERRRLDELAAGSPEFRREVDAVTAMLADATASLVPEPPPAGLRGRLLQTLASVDRFAPFFDDLTNLFELPLETIRRLLGRIDEATFRWEEQLLGVKLEGAELFHFGVGPRLAAGGAAGGVVRVRAGATFPLHSHKGNEVTYVLEGGYRADGRTYGPGSRIEVTGDVRHSYEAAPARDLLIAVLHRGVEML